MSYGSVIEALALALDTRSTQPFNLVVVDGIPAGGKSSLAAQLAAQLEKLGRPTVIIENDWFIARTIRNPLALALGLALAVSPASPDEVERRLLQRFLDQGRMGAFQRELAAARGQLAFSNAVTLRPLGAFWNLHSAPPWTSARASNGLTIRRDGVVIIEGTLTAAAYRGRFPELISVFVNVPPAVARARFLDRNQDEGRRRNRAFTALARNGLAFRLASEMIGRERGGFDFEVDLTHLDDPQLLPELACFAGEMTKLTHDLLGDGEFEQVL